mmetsp:Transcript_81416/g.263697  ORF Transcript_81416/g.263697 Transcript_81416/m.263697 type:complete len:248 (-) Transcript_81416:294-1037(-)
MRASYTLGALPPASTSANAAAATAMSALAASAAGASGGVASGTAAGLSKGGAGGADTQPAEALCDSQSGCGVHCEDGCCDCGGHSGCERHNCCEAGQCGCERHCDAGCEGSALADGARLEERGVWVDRDAHGSQPVPFLFCCDVSTSKAGSVVSGGGWDDGGNCGADVAVSGCDEPTALMCWSQDPSAGAATCPRPSDIVAALERGAANAHGTCQPTPELLPIALSTPALPRFAVCNCAALLSARKA